MPNAQVCVFDGTYYKVTSTNYISKTSLYAMFRMYSLGPWQLKKILMFALLVTSEIATYSWPWDKTRDSKYMLGLSLILISNSWGCPPWGRACLSWTATHAQRRGGRVFISARVFFLYDAWRDEWMDGWKASQKMNTTSFTICNGKKKIKKNLKK
jgi:hypothetical protein